MRRHLLFGRVLGDEHRLHAAEIEPAQHRAHRELAGAADLAQKIDCDRTKLIELARKFIRAGFPLVAEFARQCLHAPFGERRIQLAECLLDARCRTIRVRARATGVGKQCSAERLASFVGGEVARVCVEIGNGVELREDDVRRQPHAEVLRGFAEAVTDLARRRGDALTATGLVELVAREADHREARRLSTSGEGCGQTSRTQRTQQAMPRRRILEERATGFDNDTIVRVPEVDARRRCDGLTAEHVAGEQLGIEARANDRRRLGARLRSNHQQNRQGTERRFAAALRGGELGPGRGESCVDATRRRSSHRRTKIVAHEPEENSGAHQSEHRKRDDHLPHLGPVQLERKHEDHRYQQVSGEHSERDEPGLRRSRHWHVYMDSVRRGTHWERRAVSVFMSVLPECSDTVK